jgi:hypothetical protein
LNEGAICRCGLFVSVSLALSEVEKIERILTLLRDSAAIYPEWKRLVVRHSVLGAKVHDARLVAAMNVHRIARILTFNAGDFACYGIEVLLAFSKWRCLTLYSKHKTNLRRRCTRSPPPEGTAGDPDK